MHAPVRSPRYEIQRGRAPVRSVYMHLFVGPCARICMHTLTHVYALSVRNIAYTARNIGPIEFLRVKRERTMDPMSRSRHRLRRRRRRRYFHPREVLPEFIARASPQTVPPDPPGFCEIHRENRNLLIGDRFYAHIVVGL